MAFTGCEKSMRRYRNPNSRRWQADESRQIETKSKDVGAVSHHTLDVKREFVEDYVFPSIKANGLYEWKSSEQALARPSSLANLSISPTKKEPSV